ncbi:MAG: TonB-dependent receptor plug domain-containing protein, partial [Cyclobacteriaceae bacterium]
MSKICIYGIIVQLSLFTFVFATSGDAQTKSVNEIPITINLPNPLNLDDLINQIEETTGFSFSHIKQEVNTSSYTVILDSNELVLGDLLASVSSQTDLSFHRVNEYIQIRKREIGGDAVVEKITVKQTVKGSITDENGEYLPGATILEKGTNNGTVSDINGNFSLEVNEGAVLVISFVGYIPSEIVVDNRSQINISLEPDLESLDEVVVIGYGEVRKRDLTGAISSVKVEENVSRQYNSVDMMLQGRAAGVQVSSNAGNPGQSISVNIRGTSTLSGKSQPLYVIDGVIVNSASEEVLKTVDDGNEYQAPQNGLSGLNPQDIESMEVLKDASATAIYGSRGANGVVLITTKKGKSGEAKINVYSTIDFSVISKTLDVMDALTYAEFRLEQSDLTNSPPDYSIQGKDVYRISYDTGEPVTSSNPIKQISWQDELYKTGVSYNEGITISGA